MIVRLFFIQLLILRKVGSVKPSVHFRQNVLATYNLLEMLTTCCWMFQRLRGLDGNRGITALRLCG